MADSDDAFQILIYSINLYQKGLAQGEQGLFVFSTSYGLLLS